MIAIIVAYVVIEAIAWLVFTALCGENIYFNPVENYKTWDSLNWFGVWVVTMVYWIAFLPLIDDFDRARAKVIIMGQPTADVVEVVRCKDCILHKEGCPLDIHPYMTPDDGYCYKGKRKDNE